MLNYIANDDIKELKGRCQFDIKNVLILKRILQVRKMMQNACFDSKHQSFVVKRD